MATVIRPPATILSTFIHNPQIPSISSVSATNPTHRFKPAFFLSSTSKSIQKPIIGSDPELNSVDYVDLLKLSVRYADVELTRAIHAFILKLEEDTRLSTAVVSAYLKLGLVDYAHNVFDNITDPDVTSYCVMISGFAKANREVEAVELFFEMRSSGIEPNEYSFVALLTACIRFRDLELGLQVHGLVVKLAYLDCTHVVNALMGLYSKCGCLDFVIELFENLGRRDIASWNTVISGMVKECMYDRAFELFKEMPQIDCRLRVDYITLSTLLTASSGCFRRRIGRELHAHALRRGYERNLSVNNALIKFYTRCGSIKNVMALFEKMQVRDVFTLHEMITAYMESGLVSSAEELFSNLPEKNAISYNILLAGFCQNGEASKALALFCTMLEESIEICDITLNSVANTCGLLMERKTSEQIHGFILKSGIDPYDDCIAVSLIDMCMRCARKEDAEKIFNRLPSEHDRSITLTSMVCGYAQNGNPEEAIYLLKQLEGLVFDEVASATILGLCGNLGLQRLGANLHSHALKHGFLSDVAVENALISMYARCDELGDAIKAFELMSTRDLVSWNSLLISYALHRRGDEALNTWSKMEKLGIVPDSITCLHILSAYIHTTKNRVDCCKSFFFSMQRVYGILPTSDHYACLVSVLAQWGLLEEAEEMVNRMPFEPNSSVWRALLNGCRINFDSSIGKRVVKRILSIDPQDPSLFILKSNLYSASGIWHCSELVREEMKEKGFKKIPGRSWIIDRDQPHWFFARDKTHPMTKDVYSGLEILILECMKAGYVPDTSFVLHEVEEYQKKYFLFYHSSKLALAFGLLTTKHGKPIRVMKNILLCGDCHAFFKVVSLVARREIHVRDASGFHCFVNGKCSCNDRW